MGNPISSRALLEFTRGFGLRGPMTAGTSRVPFPSFLQSEQYIAGNETVTIPVNVGALSAGASGTFTGSQPFSVITSVMLSPYDQGRALFLNVSVDQVANGIVGHPTITLYAGTTPIPTGEFLPGGSYADLTLQAAITVLANGGAVSAGVVNVTATAMLFGEATDD